MLNHKNERIRFIKFSLVGISGTILDFSIFNLLLHVGLSTIFASALSFTIAVFNNFFWNRKWTYPESKTRPVGSQLIKFGLISTVGLVVRSFLLGIIENPMIAISKILFNDHFFIPPDIIGKNISLSIVIIIILFWNYIANRLWTYKNI